MKVGSGCAISCNGFDCNGGFEAMSSGGRVSAAGADEIVVG